MQCIYRIAPGALSRARAFCDLRIRGFDAINIVIVIMISNGCRGGARAIPSALSSAIVYSNAPHTKRTCAGDCNNILHDDIISNDYRMEHAVRTLFINKRIHLFSSLQIVLNRNQPKNVPSVTCMKSDASAVSHASTLTNPHTHS